MIRARLWGAQSRALKSSGLSDANCAETRKQRPEIRVAAAWAPPRGAPTLSPCRLEAAQVCASCRNATGSLDLSEQK